MIIGGGTTGAGIARDLSLRGIKCMLAEQGDINSGASGANHGLLHSGARYICKDGETAAECVKENSLLKKLAPHCIEETGGLFVAVQGDDEGYIADFPGMCEKCGIPAEEIPPEQARRMEPCISENAVSVFRVNDATVDPFMLSLDNIADAEANGAGFLRNKKVTGFDIQNGVVRCAHVTDIRTGESFRISALQYVNATGAWAGNVAAMAGADFPVIYSKGTLLITQDRISSRVINRLRKASDADILAPGGTISIAGTTSVEIGDLNDIRPTIREVDEIIKQGAMMVPELKTARYIRAYAGVRALVSSRNNKGRSVSRNYTLLEHKRDGLENFITITGGKLTTFRLMAEKTSDLVAERLNNSNPCMTASLQLPQSAKGEWTEPGRAPEMRAGKAEPEDTLICECEMVSESVADSIIQTLKEEGASPDLEEVGHRSRIGKGPCQGTFCAFRLAAFLYRTGELDADQGIEQVRQFVNERWKGFQPLVRDRELIRVELRESIFCGLLGIEDTSDLL